MRSSFFAVILTLAFLHSASAACPDFAQPVSMATGGWPTASAVGDFNRDGRADLAVANYGGSSVSILLGNGDGSLHSPAYFVTGDAPRGVAVADFNRDGRPDVVIANTSNISILLGNGDGTFSSQTIFNAADVLQAVATGDFNRDGKTDLAVAAGTGVVLILLGNGDGTFGAPSSAPAGGPGSNINAVQVADFNRDGNADFVVSAFVSGGVYVSLGDGHGSFAAPVFHASGVHPMSVAVADVNGDGKIDLAVTHDGSSWISILEGSGDGTFGAAVHYPAATSMGIAAGDFNSDGKPDMAIANFHNATVTVLLNTGGAFAAPLTYPSGTQPASVVAADFDNDGRTDIGLTATYPANVSILRNISTCTTHCGSFVPSANLAAQYPWSSSVGIADFNGDGRSDVAAIDGAYVAVYPGNGDGTFGSSVRFFLTSNTASITAGDLNDDGKPDLAVGMAGPQILVVLGHGDGTFAQPVAYNSGWSPRSIAISDANRDGRSDLIAVTSSPSGVDVLLGNGDGTFQTAVHYYFYNPSMAALSDFDRDGNVDVAICSTYDAEIAILLGNGDGTFRWHAVALTPVHAEGHSPPHTMMWGLPQYSIATADFDGDGKSDLVLAGGDTVAILIGHGDGAFDTVATYTMAPTPNGVATGDFDTDGKSDVAVIDNEGGLSILIGAGDGTFAAPVRYKFMSQPVFVATGDFNGDGRRDLIAVDIMNSKLPVLLNLCPTVRPVTQVEAHATTATKIQVSWTGTCPATCNIYRSVDHTHYVPAAVATNSPFLDAPPQSNTAYLYKVRASDGVNESPDSNTDLALSLLFKEQLVSGMTFVKSDHLTELRTATDAVRVLAGLGCGTYSPVAPQVSIKAVHVLEVRTQLDEAMSVLNLPQGYATYTDRLEFLTPAIVVKGVHFQEIRDRLK